MTFMEWCVKGINDTRDLHIITDDGREYLPGVPVLLLELETLKPMKVVGRPKLVDNIWQVKLSGGEYHDRNRISKRDRK